MANTYNDYTGDGSNRYFNLNFEYLRDDHVKVKVDGSEVGFVINTDLPTKRVYLNTAPANGAEVKVYRDSRGDFEPIADFVDGSVLTGDDLDEAYLHNLYVAQETSQGVGGELLFKKNGVDYDAEGNKIINLGTPTASTDAANKGYVDQTIDNSIALGGSPAIVSLGGYDVTALGTTRARSLADRFADVVNVLDYGASTSNTAADNQTAFQNALAAGNSIFIPEGTYNLTGNLYFNGRGKKLMGAGQGATKLVIDSGNTGIIAGNSVAPGTTNHEMSISDLWISGGAYGLQLGTSISPKTFFGEVSRVKITGASSAGLKLYQAIAKISRCDINQNQRGVETLQTDGASTSTVFDHCRMYQNTTEGVYLENTWGFHFNSCNFESNGKEGVKVVKFDGLNLTNLHFNGCWFENNLTDGTTGSANFLAVSGAETRVTNLSFEDCEFNTVSNDSSNKHIKGYFTHVLFNQNRFLSPSSNNIELDFAFCTGTSIGELESFVNSRLVTVINSSANFLKGTLNVSSDVTVDDGKLIASDADQDSSHHYVKAESVNDGDEIFGVRFGTSTNWLSHNHYACGSDAARMGLYWGLAGIANYRMWVDDTGDLRMWTANPTYDEDGVRVGNQTFTGTHIYLRGDKDLEVGEAVKLVQGKLYRTDSANDPKCCGIYAGLSWRKKTSLGETINSEVDSNGNLVLNEDIASGVVISLGDTRNQQSGYESIGALVDCDVVAGDLLCSSSTAGKLTKQSDDLIHSYTVAKAMEDGNASNPVYCYILQ